MSSYQVYLYEEQKQFLLKYIRERRYKNMLIMWIAAVFISVYMVMFLLLCHKMTFIRALAHEGIAEGFIYFIIAVSVFAGEFIRGFGKTFGFGCDKKCIENDWYTLTCGKFVYRDKNPHNKHPYYISDKSYNQYICPRFLDWRNADENTMFIYIKLENGRGYAISDT